ncbi:MAG: GNAT family N-acetyltransferase [Salinibacterium sp.]|nr:GNAT family N-acetyltransferase [Salinibacterium sp.]
MHVFVETAVTDAAAHALLSEYFAYREQTFPSADGYVTTFPAPSDFTPPAGLFLVVEIDGIAAGCGGIRSRGHDRFEVKHLWLRPAAQGQGLGRALLADLERRAAELGARELVLDTNSSLTAAGGLYSSSGYRAIEAYNDNPNATNWYAKNVSPR